MSPNPHHPLDAADADTSEEVAMSPGRARSLTSDAPASAIDWRLALGVAGLVFTLSGIIGHAYVLDDHVKQLDAARAAEVSEHAAFEDRMRTIEATADRDRAAADKREALIEKSLTDIGDRLDAIQKGVDQLQRHR